MRSVESIDKNVKTGRISGKQKNPRKQGESEEKIEKHGKRGRIRGKHPHRKTGIIREKHRKTQGNKDKRR